MKVKITDSGRSQSKRPKAKKDCFPRAIANATGMDYDEAYDLAREFGFEGHRGLPAKDCKKFKEVTQLGEYEIEWIYLPPEKGKPRPNTHTIGEMFPKGRYILREAGHYSALVDGVLYDINDRSERYPRCVYGVFEIKEQ